ncbi:CvpA family protein [Vannielia sp.]|uniref:CvpA family protein n=1 Tax=Vannielia sp. TaxID=2813045 RepID=UPI0026227F8C|nr:CvpA family protein [Vannielia sp.]MDF1872106.1 CvpA family protein [Vannielia sp.]
MDGFTIFDAGVAIVIVLSAILAYSRGFVREVLAIAGWVGAAVLAYIFAPQAVPLVKEIPVVADFLDNCELATGAGFVVVFAIGLVLFALFTPLFASLVQRSALNALDQGLGFIFGAVRGLLLVAIALVLYDFIAGSESLAFVDESQTSKLFGSAKTRIDGEIADQDGVMQWFSDRMDNLTERSCGPTEAIVPADPTALPDQPVDATSN